VYPYNISGNPRVITAHDGSTLPRADAATVFRPASDKDKPPPERLKQQQQCSDVQVLLRHWSNTGCGGHSVFLLSEDDVRPCAGSMIFFGFLQNWALDPANLSKWGMIRVGVGLTGLLLKCSSLPSVLHFLSTNRYHTSHAVDASISRFFMDHRVTFGPERVFRYSLADHISAGSTIWQSTYVQRRNRYKVPPCFGPIVWDGSWHEASFDMPVCETMLFSPCDDLKGEHALPAPFELLNPSWSGRTAVRDQRSSSEPADQTVLPPDVHSEASTSHINADADAGDGVLALGHLNTLELVNIAAPGHSCAEFCEDRSLICREALLQFVNRCDLMKQAFPSCKVPLIKGIDQQTRIDVLCFLGLHCKRMYPLTHVCTFCACMYVCAVGLSTQICRYRSAPDGPVYEPDHSPAQQSQQSRPQRGFRRRSARPSTRPAPRIR